MKIKYGNLTPHQIDHLDAVLKDYNNGTFILPRLDLHSKNYEEREEFIEDIRFAVHTGAINFDWDVFLDANDYIDDHLTTKPRLKDDSFQVLYAANVLFFNEMGRFFSLF